MSEPTPHEEQPLTGSQKITPRDMASAWNVLCKLRGRDSWTGSFAESVASRFMAWGYTQRDRGARNGEAMAAISLVAAMVLACGTTLLDMYMVYLGYAHRGDKCEQPLHIFLLVSGLVGLFVIPVAAVNRLVAQFNRGSGSALLKIPLSLLPVFNLVWLLVGAWWTYSINDDRVTPTSATVCPAALFNFCFYYVTIALALYAFILWAALVLAFLLCIGCTGARAFIPGDLWNYRASESADKGEEDVL